MKSALPAEPPFYLLYFAEPGEGGERGFEVIRAPLGRTVASVAADRPGTLAICDNAGKSLWLASKDALLAAYCRAAIEAESAKLDREEAL